MTLNAGRYMTIYNHIVEGIWQSMQLSSVIIKSPKNKLVAWIKVLRNVAIYVLFNTALIRRLL